MPDLIDVAPRASQALSARAATLAERVAVVLDQGCSPESGAAEAAAFLRRWAGSATAAAEPELADQPLDRLARRYALTAAECDLLLLAGLPDEHEGLASTFRALHPRSEPRPTAGLGALVLGSVTDDRSAMRTLLVSGAAVRHRLLQLLDGGALFERGLGLAENLWDALHGCDAWPASLHRLPVGAPPAGLRQWLTEPGVRRVVAALRRAEPLTVTVRCDDESVALGRCAAVAAAAGVPLVAARVTAADRSAVALLAAHAAARGALAVVVVPPPTDPATAPVHAAAFADVPGPLVVCAPPGAFRPDPDRAVLALPLGPIRTEDHRDAWRAALPDMAAHAAAMAARHPLDPALTATVALDADARRRSGGTPLDLAGVAGLIRDRAGATLPPGITLVTPSVAWNRLVMPVEGGQQLRDAVTRLDHQSTVLENWGLRERARASRGARLLFTGPPGTGKSLAAEAVATAAATDMLIVDASQIVSKWIGETEKNLAAAFDVAERTQAVLFVDEADALFGARTEISDAHDRYANLETAYLLQRLDHFDGLGVLATNLRHNIDPAFLRRVDFVVEFPLPDRAGRAELWALHLPVNVLGEDVDITALARFYPVSGGLIRNAAIAAAFLAAADGNPIGQHHLVAAVRREYAKAALPFPGEPQRRRLEAR